MSIRIGSIGSYFSHVLPGRSLASAAKDTIEIVLKFRLILLQR